MSRLNFLLLAAVIALAACAPEDAPPAPQSTSTEAAAAPTAAPEVIAIYNRSCRSCHAQGQGRAPLTGAREAWAPRLAQGMDVLLDHTINGYQGMPPMGMCFDCEEADFVALINYMSGS
jgi:cytochrome c5